MKSCFIDVLNNESFNPSPILSSLKNESVLKVVGKVCERESKNMNIPTGEIEIEVEEMELLNTSKDIPFEISEAYMYGSEGALSVAKTALEVLNNKKLRVVFDSYNS